MKKIDMKYKFLAAVLVCSLTAMSVAACSSSTENTASMQQTANASTATVTARSAAEISDVFSAKDLDASYDESTAQVITLNGSSASSDSSSVSINGSVITIKGKGTYIVTGTLDDGYIVVDAGDSDDIKIVLKDASITSSDYAALYCLNADNVNVILADGTVNTLKNGGKFDSKDKNSVDGAIFAKTDITINGSGSLEIVSSAHGIVGKDDVTITGGNIKVTATSDGIQANDSVAIQNAAIDITCGKDGIQADNEKDTSKGYVYILSGNITIAADDDGITASSTLQVDGGTINITKSYEGLEGETIIINDGMISMVCSDDGLNAASSSAAESMMDDGVSNLIIRGGDIYIRSEGDGVDSNGTLLMTGGALVVMGPTIGGNGSLDVNGSATITGGTVIMAGSSDMATNFTEASQGTILLTTGNQSQGTDIKVTDSSGNVILEATSDCTYQCIVVSSPLLTTGNTYTVTAGTFSETITLSSNIYGTGNGFGVPGGGFAGGQNGGFEGGPGGAFGGDNGFNGSNDGGFGGPGGGQGGFPDNNQNGGPGF